MTTVARPTSIQSPHWYQCDGTPCYEIEKKGGGMRPVTLADARKLNLLPSVTNVTGIIDKPALNRWKQEQVALSLLTTPRFEGESLDEFVFRILHTERVQDQEAKRAADRGTEIHKALEKLFNGESVGEEILPWVDPVYRELVAQFDGAKVTTEHVLVGEGYAGKADLIVIRKDVPWIYDFKTTKKIPDEPYPENRLQLSAYAGCSRFPREVANVYISTAECGKFTIHEHGNWLDAFNAFQCLVTFWQWSTGYQPKQ